MASCSNRNSFLIFSGVLLLSVLFPTIESACSYDSDCPGLLNNNCCGGQCEYSSCPFTTNCVWNSDCSGARVCCSSGDCRYNMNDCPMAGGSIAGIIVGLLVVVGVIAAIVMCCVCACCPLHHSRRHGGHVIVQQQIGGVQHTSTTTTTLHQPPPAHVQPPPVYPQQGQYPAPPLYSDQQKPYPQVYTGQQPYPGTAQPPYPGQQPYPGTGQPPYFVQQPYPAQPTGYSPPYST